MAGKQITRQRIAQKVDKALFGNNGPLTSYDVEVIVMSEHRRLRAKVRAIRRRTGPVGQCVCDDILKAMR